MAVAVLNTTAKGHPFFLNSLLFHLTRISLFQRMHLSFDIKESFNFKMKDTEIEMSSIYLFTPQMPIITIQSWALPKPVH